MALIRGLHVIFTHKVQHPDVVARNIQRNGLLIGQSLMGSGAYAFYANMVPVRHFRMPAVLFEVDDSFVKHEAAPMPARSDFGFMKMWDPSRRYIPVRVLGFLNIKSLSRDTTAFHYDVTYVALR